MSKDEPASVGRAAGGERPAAVPRHVERFYWDDDVAVPAELHLTCQGCGCDLTGLDRRTCPNCGKKFHVPIPEELDLHCAECDYNLTGLVSRTCPECGTKFVLRERVLERRAGSRLVLRDRIPWDDWVIYLLAAVLGGFGVVVILHQAPPLIVIYLVTGFGVGAVAYIRGNDLPRIILWIGVTWAIMGLLVLLVS
jgi:predicted RNA-binding Zn-ribbon protein involved in translation (DUF1610 family)